MLSQVSILRCSLPSRRFYQFEWMSLEANSDNFRFGGSEGGRHKNDGTQMAANYETRFLA